MNTITINGKKYFAPSNWNEMSRKQFVIWSNIHSKSFTVEQAFLLASALFYRIPKRIFFKLNAVEQYEISKTLTFLWDQHNLVRWMIPTVNVFFTKYHGPDDRLSYSSIKEFRFCELYYNMYKMSGDEKLLDLLIATLYRKAGANDAGNDHREKLTDIKVRTQAWKMNRLSSSVRKAILFNYEGCSAYIRSKYPIVFKPTKDKSNALPDMEELIKAVAGGKFGTFIETENTPLYLFLDHLSLHIEESEKSTRK
jgi:hypothetical protein